MTYAQQMLALFHQQESKSPKGHEIFIAQDHPLADIVGKVTFVTRRDTAEHYPVYFTTMDNGMKGWFVFKDVPDDLKHLLLHKLGYDGPF